MGGGQGQSQAAGKGEGCPGTLGLKLMKELLVSTDKHSPCSPALLSLLFLP